MIDLASLVALRAVDTHGSVVAAADALGFTPSAVSQQVKRLERQVGVPLLERIGRGVMLTHAGRHLVDEGSQLLADMESLESGLHEQATTVAGRLRLTAFSTAMRGMVAPVAGELRTAHPDLALTLSEREPWDTVDLVATGHSPDHLVTTELHRDIADVIAHRDHPLAQLAKVTPHDLVAEDWIATPEGTICRQWLNRMYAGTGQLPRIAHVSMEFDSHLALVRAGLGIALIPRMGRAALGEDLVAVRVVDPVPTREILALHRRTMAASPAVTAVLTALAGQNSAEASD
jgi:DNA-binding transcriptional LysR family regulator